MNKLMTAAVVISMGFALAGCPKKPTVRDNPGSGTQVPADENANGANGNAQTEAATPFGGDGSASAAVAAMRGKIIYFDYDKIEIKPEFADVVTQVARILASHPNWKVRLEGNTDERGTREYNIGLGERRAQAVRRALMLQGAGDTQLTTVSYGEEGPAVDGEDEAAFAKNRRVELVAIP